MAAQHKPEFIERIRSLMAEGKSPAEAGELVGLSRKAVTHLAWRYKMGAWHKHSREPVVLRPVPADFAEHFAHETLKQLRNRYTCAHLTVTRWAKECGLAKPTRAPANSVKSVKPVKHTSAWRPTLAGRQPIDRAHRDTSDAGSAADWLRRYGPVARCNPDGTYNPKGNHWRRNGFVLTADEVIERAERLGWKRWDVAA